MMTTAFPFSWQPKLKKPGLNLIENSIVKIKGLYILPFNKKPFFRKLVTWTIVGHYTSLPHKSQKHLIKIYAKLFKNSCG